MAENEHYLHRPYLRKSTREGINRVTDEKQWKFKQDKQNYTKEYTGKVKDGPLRDENTGRIIEGKPDIGHRSGYEERVMQECAERMHLSQKDYNELMNNPKLYQFEDKSSNRSHGFEETNKKAQVSKAMREINRYMDSKNAGEHTADRRVHKPAEHASKSTARSTEHTPKSASKPSEHTPKSTAKTVSDRTMHTSAPRRTASHGSASHASSSHGTSSRTSSHSTPSHSTSSHSTPSHSAPSSHSAPAADKSHGSKGGHSH